MDIELFDPVGVVEAMHSKQLRALPSIAGKRMGCIFNQHVSALSFWKGMETEIEAKFKPSGIHRIYKANTWAPAPRAEVDKLLQETDYALVGVGA